MQDRFRLQINPEALTKALAEELAEQCGRNLERGLAPSGERLPPLSEESRRRRARAGYTGPRGVRTGRFASSFQARPARSGSGYEVAPLEVARGQFLAILGGVSPRVRLGAIAVREAMRQALKSGAEARALEADPLDFGDALL